MTPAATVSNALTAAPEGRISHLTGEQLRLAGPRPDQAYQTQYTRHIHSDFVDGTRQRHSKLAQPQQTAMAHEVPAIKFTREQLGAPFCSGHRHTRSGEPPTRPSTSSVGLTQSAST